MKCEFCGRKLRYDFELESGICENCLLDEPPPDKKSKDSPKNKKK
jgi:hypothetical protein